jgi:hypothetical protein
VAQNLAFALPPPWGPVVAAGLQLLDFLLPVHGQDPFQTAVDSLEQFQTTTELAEHASYLKDYAGWLQQMQDAQDMLGAPNPAFITGTLLPGLEGATGPNGQLFTGLSDLGSLASGNDDALDLLVLAQSLYVLSLKMIVQLRAVLAKLANDSGDQNTFTAQTDAWYGAYAVLLVHVRGDGGLLAGCAQQVTNLVNGRFHDRLAQITAPYAHNQIIPGGRANVNVIHGWTFRDAAVGDSDNTRFQADTTAGDACHTYTVSHQADVQQAHDSYVAGITAGLHQRWDNATATASKWSDAILSWEQHMPPKRPQNPPQLPPAAQWAEAAPSGSVWERYGEVYYAVAYVNASGPSPISGWAGQDIGGRAHPTLTLPADPLQMATHWWVYRHFADAANNPTPMALIGIVATTSPTYTDTRD